MRACRPRRYVYVSADQNRLLFSDYERLVADSAFERLFLKGYDHPELQTRNIAGTSAEHFALLNERYPDDRDRFVYDGITMLLRK
jgi:hypothetical protein